MPHHRPPNQHHIHIPRTALVCMRRHRPELNRRHARWLQGGGNEEELHRRRRGDQPLKEFGEFGRGFLESLRGDVGEEVHGRDVGVLDFFEDDGDAELGVCLLVPWRMSGVD